MGSLAEELSRAVPTHRQQCLSDGDKNYLFILWKPRSSLLCFQNIGESEIPSVLNQLLPMIKSHNERTANDYTSEDFLVLLVYIYSVVGEIKAGKELDQAEEEVKKALVRTFCDEPELSSLLQKITGEFIFQYNEKTVSMKFVPKESIKIT